MSTAEAVCNCGGQTYWQQAHGWCSCISEGLRYSVYLVYQGEQGSRGNLHAASYPYAVVWSKADAWFKGFVWGLWNSQMVWLGLKLSHTVVVNLQIRLKGSQGSTAHWASVTCSGHAIWRVPLTWCQCGYCERLQMQPKQNSLWDSGIATHAHTQFTQPTPDLLLR